jgi:hypothetical protein
MCKITLTLHTCKHDIQHILSHCRGQIKEGPDTNVPACHQKGYNLRVRNSHKCCECLRADVKKKIYRDLGITALTEAQQTEVNERLTEAFRNIPSTAKWHSTAPTVYGRRPSQSRSVTRRKGSLLRQEVKAEDVGGPEAWESSVVPASADFIPVYKEVCNGWDVEWPPETKSLAEELAEDAAASGMEVEDDRDQDEDDQDGEDQDGSEEDDGELGVCEEDDLLLLAQQTPLPLDPEVDDMHDDHHTECDSSSPTKAVDTPMLAQHDTISADDASTFPEITLDTAFSESTTQHLPVLESDSQLAESSIRGGNTPASFTRVKTPYGRSWQLAGDNKVRYWYRQHKSGSPEGKHVMGCRELVNMASV